jgi:hypothetical protein
MTRRIGLELRRLRGWLAYAFVIRWPGCPFVLIGWAGLYAHWDYDRRNWQDTAA